MTTPGCFAVLGKKPCSRQLILRLVLEEFNCLSAEHHVPPAQFGRPALTMSQSQAMAVEIHHQGGRKFFRPRAGELEPTQESSRSGRGNGDHHLALSGWIERRITH